MGNFTYQILSGSKHRFSPKADLAKKQNYCMHVFWEPDGSPTNVVRLNVLDDRRREDIIGFHFSQQYAKLHYEGQKEQPQFNVVGRDCPWDFEYVLHDETNFFVEICRVADKDLLKAMKAENDVTALLQKTTLKGFEILKIEKHFPGTMPKELVDSVQTKADKRKNFMVDEQIETPKMFIRPPMTPRGNLIDMIKTAIEKKVAKRHNDKDRTILLLDNLTTHEADPEHFFEARDALQKFLNEVPFPSIWLYTGYYSDDNCEYSFVPIKLSPREVDSLRNKGGYF